MICPTCQGDGREYIGWAFAVCSECYGSGIVSCCDKAGDNFGLSLDMSESKGANSVKNAPNRGVCLRKTELTHASQS